MFKIIIIIEELNNLFFEKGICQMRMSKQIQKETL